jgi:hypothetical protein
MMLQQDKKQEQGFLLNRNSGQWLQRGSSEVYLLKNLIDIGEITESNFEFGTTRNYIRVAMKERTYYSAITRHFYPNNLHYFTFHPKSERPIKAAVRHPPSNTPADDI